MDPRDTRSKSRTTARTRANSDDPGAAQVGRTTRAPCIRSSVRPVFATVNGWAAACSTDLRRGRARRCSRRSDWITSCTGRGAVFRSALKAGLPVRAPTGGPPYTRGRPRQEAGADTGRRHLGEWIGKGTDHHRQRGVAPEFDWARGDPARTPRSRAVATLASGEATTARAIAEESAVARGFSRSLAPGCQSSSQRATVTSGHLPVRHAGSRPVDHLTLSRSRPQRPPVVGCRAC